MIQISGQKIRAKESEIEKLEQQEKDLIKKFEEKRDNVLCAINTNLEEILKECDGNSKLKLILVIEG